MGCLPAWEVLVGPVVVLAAPGGDVAPRVVVASVPTLPRVPSRVSPTSMRYARLRCDHHVQYHTYNIDVRIRGGQVRSTATKTKRTKCYQPN